MPRTVLFLHGFGGSRRSWDGVIAHLDASRYRSLAVDLPGHGACADVRPASYESAVQLALAGAPGKLVVCGYSMGARVALTIALTHPERTDALVLVSAHAGIEDDDQRAARRAADEELATRIEQMDGQQFADLWNRQPLFAGDPPGVLAAARGELVRQQPHALAAALRGLGPGVFDPVWSELAGLDLPLLALAGERDERYVGLARRLALEARRGGAQILPGGHRLALESPGALARALEGLDAEAA